LSAQLNLPQTSVVLVFKGYFLSMLFFDKSSTSPPDCFRQTTRSEAEATHPGVLHQLQALWD